jgi:hypothetical protein
VAETVLTESPARPALHKSSGFLKTGMIAATNYLKSYAIMLCSLPLHRLSNRESPLPWWLKMEEVGAVQRHPLRARSWTTISSID